MFLFSWLLICITLLFSPGVERVQKSSLPESLSDWVKVAPPKYESDAWRAANGSDYEWQVAMKDGRPVAHRRNAKSEEASALPALIKKTRGLHPRPGEIHATQVPDGWLISFNTGEFGGSLWWYGSDGRQSYQISNDQIVEFLPTNRGLFALEGLEHGGLSRGQIIQLRPNSQGQWMSSRFIDLGHAPYVGMAVTGGDFLVCTTDGLVLVHPDQTQTELVSKAFWSGLYPHSMALSPTGDIYLGMRHGVALVYKRDRAYVTDWLLPNRDFVRAKPKD